MFLFIFLFLILPQAPVLFKGIGHSINPANNLVKFLHLISIETACMDLDIILLHGSQ